MPSLTGKNDLFMRSCRCWLLEVRAYAFLRLTGIMEWPFSGLCVLVSEKPSVDSWKKVQELFFQLGD